MFSLTGLDINPFSYIKKKKKTEEAKGWQKIY